MLKLVFEESEHLTKEKKLELVRVTGLDMEQVSSWFNRKRARKRARESKGDLEHINAELKQSLQACQEREAKLRKELQESKRKEAEIESENQNLQRRLAIAEGDLQLHPLIRFINGYS
ncbi:UNVERIFIED_CONTAM: hypothetical protein Sangu_0545500 [Sesamum angustifolium]|uniref:Homeobox domain-containing protein n=1 Tax=Sesamum angustifolium TaxID=2727405 RepID=A0AAW2Q9E4_9LAMI